MQKKTILSIRGLTKTFPGVVAVSNAELDIRGGEVHSLVGGNGAGKSTLMKMISGFYPKNSYQGKFFLDDEECIFNSVLEAQDKGIAIIPQELNMLDELSVAENLFLNNYPKKNLFIDKEHMYSEAQKILNDFELKLDPKTKVKEIGIAQKQLLVIARAMYRKVKVLLLDEPTSTLSDNETKILFEKIHQLRKQGIALVYISHRLEEVSEISDVITVMRDGKIVGTDNRKNMDSKRIISMMIGRQLDELYPAHNRTSGDVVLQVDSITIFDPKTNNKKIVDDVSFDLKKGEILSMYGLVGSGRTESALAIIGGFNGEVYCKQYLHGKEIQITSPNEATKYKIGYLPEDRKKHGTIDGSSVKNNITVSSLSNLSKYGILDKDKEQRVVDSTIDNLDIRTPSSETIIDNLSGGNAQKCVLGRWIAANSDVLILDEATQGIDVEAKNQVYQIMDELARKGKAILFISSDLDEVMGISDRILTMRHGRVINITEGKNAKKEKILWEATMGAEGELNES